MSTRRRLASLLVLVVLASGGVAAARALAPGAVRQPSPVERVQRFYPEGPSAVYESDTGGIGVVAPLRFAVHGGGSQAGVVEASFGYRTRGPGPFVVSVGVREVDGPRVTVRPARLVLAPAPEGAATTVRFLARGLSGGRDHEASLAVNSVAPATGTNKVSTHKVVLTVELG